MLKIENISTGYGKKQVLFDVSFEISKGDIVLLAGANGSGKSTLLKAIYGLLPLWNGGQVTFNGEDITGKPTSALLKRGLLYIPQKNNLFENLTVKENLEMAGLTLNQKSLKERIDFTLSVFEFLKPMLSMKPIKLSGGERRILTLAMAALHDPKMILIDEPFTGLSPQNITFVANNLKDINENGRISLFVVEHRVKESLRIANRVIGLKLGMIINQTEVFTNFDFKVLNPIFV
jgi:branched-chain amino acid transport system ATP-binding protein